MFLKVAVVNNSGNVGKTTLCETLLKPRLDGAELIKVESINSDGTDDEKFNALEFVDIFKKIDNSDVVIVDIGSSNIEMFTNKLRKFKDSQEDFDFFIIPVVPEYKQQIDSLVTIETLMDLNVEPERIRIVFNMIDEMIPFERQFKEILESKTYKSLKLKGSPRIPKTELFSHLALIGKRYEEVKNDDRDFRALLRQIEDREERMLISEERSIKRLVTGFDECLDTAFTQLHIN
ncbi:TPA: StbB family protein [Salmonella enterica]